VVIRVGHRSTVCRTRRPDSALIGQQARNVGVDQRPIQTMALRGIVVQLHAGFVAFVPGRRKTRRQRIVIGESRGQRRIILLVKIDDLLRDLADAVGWNNVSWEYGTCRRIDNRPLNGLAGAVSSQHGRLIQQSTEISTQEFGCGNS